VMRLARSVTACSSGLMAPSGQSGPLLRCGSGS
jgi:hypothetical protein